jgi:hypothetical protein
MKKANEWLKEFWFLWFFLLLSYLILRISGFDIKIVRSDENKTVLEIGSEPQGGLRRRPGT